MMENVENKASTTLKSEKGEIWPQWYVHKHQKTYIKRTGPEQAELIEASGRWPTHFGSKELLDARIKSYTPCTEEEYLSAL